MSNNEADDKPNKNVVEQHIQTIVVVATISILSWVLLSVLDVRDRLIKFEERLSTLSAQVNTGVDDRFRGADWRREKQVLDDRFLMLRNEVQELEKRVQLLERGHDRYHPSPR